MQRFGRILYVNKGKRVYFGKVGAHLLEIKAVYDHLFLVRPYSCASVSWRFSKEGRLELIDTKLLGGIDNKPRHILKISFEELPKEWNQAGAVLENMPEEVMYSLNYQFPDLSRKTDLQKLLSTATEKHLM